MIKRIIVILVLMVAAYFSYQKYSAKRFFLDAPILIAHIGQNISLVSLSNSKTFFDIDSDGTREKVSWVDGATTGILTIDLNNNGKIDNAGEFFGKKDKNKSMEAEFLEYDLDNNGSINTADPIFAKLLIWFDENQDGVSAAEEIHPLNPKIPGIDFKNGFSVNQKINGVTIKQQVYSSWPGPPLINIELEADKTQAVPKSYAYTAEFSDAPVIFMDFAGLGSLMTAMGKDEELYRLVKGLKTFDFNQYQKLDEIVTQIIYRWSGVESSHTDLTDSDKKTALLKMITNQKTEPAELEATWNQYFYLFRNRLVIQLTLGDTIFSGVTYQKMMYGNTIFTGATYKDLIFRVTKFYDNISDKNAANYFLNIIQKVIEGNSYQVDTSPLMIKNDFTRIREGDTPYTSSY